MSDGDGGGAARAILAANEAFYRAFAARDFDRMEGLWASGAWITCIHPGWGVVRGRGAVIASWRSILESPGSPRITCANAAAYPIGDSAYVICEEHVAGAVLVATNVFVREAGVWKLAHHQAGHVAARMPEVGPAPAPDGSKPN
jgi:ketosteroid isomerase-like protein